MVILDEAFAAQSAEAYIRDFLVKTIHPHTIIIGYDHRFGKNREGDYRMLEKFGGELGFTVKEISEKVLDEVAVSSTRIRNALREGAVEQANALLGYDYFFEGRVVEGNKLGRTIGYPTANIETGNPEKLIPGNGVYAVEVTAGGLPESDDEYWLSPHSGWWQTGDWVNIFIELIFTAVARVYVKHFLRKEQNSTG